MADTQVQEVTEADVQEIARRIRIARQDDIGVWTTVIEYEGRWCLYGEGIDDYGLILSNWWAIRNPDGEFWLEPINTGLVGVYRR